MLERHSELLLGVIEEYIQTAKPVSSLALRKSMGLNLSPATVRTALQELEEIGYLYQPHTSAGRVPTDQGYRYYVDHLNAKRLAAAELKQLLREYENSLSSAEHQLAALATAISRLSDTFVMTGQLPSGQVEQQGLSHVANRDQQEQLPTVREVSWFADHLRDHLDQLANNIGQTTIYIGQENPLHDTNHTSLVTRTIVQPNEDRTVVAIIGPKNMPYQKNIALLEALNELVDQSRI